MVKHLKVSKHYETDCQCNFIYLLMFLLTAKVVKTSHIWARTYFNFVKNVKNKLETLLIPNFNLSEKIVKAVMKWGEFWTFLAFNYSNFTSKCVKSLRASKSGKKWSLNWSAASLNKKKQVSGHSNSENILD